LQLKHFLKRKYNNNKYANVKILGLEAKKEMKKKEAF
jgi:hypothetical protein